ncbi:MAG: AraC family transcriptional regulator [Propionibacteriales bacterium]|nr:AraC family transcriptional regulator [Propionibacteriales bacterium]
MLYPLSYERLSTHVTEPSALVESRTRPGQTRPWRTRAQVRQANREDLSEALAQREPDVTIGAIAREVGYGSGFALSTVFKRVRGISPQEHRLVAARA